MDVHGVIIAALVLLQGIDQTKRWGESEPFWAELIFLTRDNSSG